MNDKLLELARAYGVILEYYDIWGQQHHTGEHALRSVLQAMGIEAADDAAVEASLTRTQQARWARVLPPATVVRRDASPWTIRLQLPAASLGDELAWTVREEDGDRHEGRLQPASLHPIERVSVAGCDYVALEWRLAFELPFGYHHVRVRRGEAQSAEMRAEMLLAVTPERCYCPPALQGEGRVWGATCQLYGVRSERNWGIGDFTDLMTLVQQWGTRGGGVIGLNPLHALYPHNPAHASPYSPSSRLFKNWIYIDVEACADFHASEEARALVR
ncbi:MAG: 4-alpha-glucanotransferase, partial [Burkholderiales bacterium]